MTLQRRGTFGPSVVLFVEDRTALHLYLEESAIKGHIVGSCTLPHADVYTHCICSNGRPGLYFLLEGFDPASSGARLLFLKHRK